jgi:hypothetical protein
VLGFDGVDHAVLEKLEVPVGAVEHRGTREGAALDVQLAVDAP